MCAKYYELRCMFKKKFTSFMLALAYSVKIGLKDEKLIKKANLHDN